MEKGLVIPNRLVTTRITPSFPWKYISAFLGSRFFICLRTIMFSLFDWDDIVHLSYVPHAAIINATWWYYSLIQMHLYKSNIHHFHWPSSSPPVIRPQLCLRELTIVFIIIIILYKVIILAIWWYNSSKSTVSLLHIHFVSFPLAIIIFHLILP